MAGLRRSGWIGHWQVGLDSPFAQAGVVQREAGLVYSEDLDERKQKHCRRDARASVDDDRLSPLLHLSQPQPASLEGGTDALCVEEAARLGVDE